MKLTSSFSFDALRAAVQASTPLGTRAAAGNASLVDADVARADISEAVGAAAHAVDEAPGLPAQALRSTARAAHGLSAGRTFALAAGVIGSIVGAAHAYPCTGYNRDVDQYFTNPNATLYGVVHGWFSDCYDVTYVCGQSCSGTGSSQSCSPIYCTDTEVDRVPADYVSAAAASVAACGFQLVSQGQVPHDPTVRIANALIERNLWVKVSVNTLNLTDTTDPAIECLHNIA